MPQASLGPQVVGPWCITGMHRYATNEVFVDFGLVKGLRVENVVFTT